MGDLILMDSERFFEVFYDLVDFRAFDEVKIESDCMLGNELPDE